MLNINFSKTLPKSAKVHVVLTDAGKKLSKSAGAVDKDSGGALKRSMASSDFTGKNKTFHIFRGSEKTADTVIVAGFGDAADVSENDFEVLGSELANSLKELKCEKVAIEVEDVKKIKAETIAVKLAAGLSLNSYQFDKYKTSKDAEEKKKNSLKEVTLVLDTAAAAKKDFADMQAIIEGVFLTRDLVWEPANELYPESFAKRIKKELSPLGVKVKIVNEAQMRKLGMNTFLSVGQGSRRESQMVIMEWNGDKAAKKNSKPLALVGKGITFDTGGISLKPGAGMWDMKWDMGGAGAVVGAMKAIAGRKAKANVVAAVALAENMPDGDATRPGDIVKSLSGQTVEILNTDAEGRLVLSDTLTYMQRNFKPELVIDLATLTGAILVALGHEYAGAFGNDDKSIKELMCAGEGVGDKVWHMPMTDIWDKQLDSECADIRNISFEKYAGSATAAAFLSRFIEDGQKWVHLDIAGMAWKPKASDSRPKGATGFGVRLLDQFVRQTIEEKTAK